MMKNLYVILVLLTFGLMNSDLKAQQIPQFRHAVFGQYYSNPAYAFDNYKPDIMLNHRSQWVGFEGAPTTSSLSGTYRFMDDMAAGIIVSNDLIGATRNLLFNLSYAYQLEINREWRMSFGIAWSIMQAQLDGSMVDLYDEDDELVSASLSGKSWKPDANAGIMLNNSSLYAGLSAMQLFESKFRLYAENSGSIHAKRHYFFTGGGHFKAGRQAMVHASILTEFAPGGPLRFDLTGMLEYNDALLAGLTYSLGDAIVLNVGYQYKEFLFLYSYDIVTSRMMSASSGAHEITLAYFLSRGQKKSNNYKPMF
ncbi:MAG: PorP/SprF family type IX secretion system membrane protein [Bacteroidota bacterium]